MNEEPQIQTGTKNVIRETDAEAISLAKTLIHTARHGALAVNDDETGFPQVSRVQLSTDVDGSLVTLVSSLAPHTRGMIANPFCSILVGEPGKGDPLAHPRITLFARAEKIARGTETHTRLRHRHLARHPKASLYADFGDFSFFRLSAMRASLNGGFGRAYELSADDLAMTGDVGIIAALEQGAVAHMNTDHAEAIGLYARHFGKAPDAKWALATLDPEGMDLTAGDQIIRVPFPEPLENASDLRKATKHMADIARQALSS